MSQFLSKRKYTVRLVSDRLPEGRLVGDFRWLWMARLAVRFARGVCYPIRGAKLRESYV